MNVQSFWRRPKLAALTLAVAIGMGGLAVKGAEHLGIINPPASLKFANADEADAPKITLDILDSSGKVIRHFPKKEDADEPDEGFGARNRSAGMLPAETGLNRFVWNLQYEGASKVPHAPLWGGSTDGPKALPGKYQVRLTVLGRYSFIEVT